MSDCENLQAENLKSVAIQDLIIRKGKNKLCFIIPYYQRGYRWSEIQVEKLLNDLNEFHEGKKNNENVGSYYCLQPIVVKQILPAALPKRLGNGFVCNAQTDYYEVVDGQQRLTTLYIFLKTLYGNKLQLFDLVYERDINNGFTRKACLDSITSIDYEKVDLNQKSMVADEYYIKNTYITLKKWIDNKMTDGMIAVEADLQQVLSETMVIWYELPQDGSVDCYAVFRNINNGKIPLTDAELVKAMLLNRKYFSPDAKDDDVRNKVISQSQDLYARQWDEIQRALSKPDVWSFITGNHDFKVHTRIDLLFKILVRKHASESAVNEELGLFSYYEEQLAKRKEADEKTKYIKSVFGDLLGLYRTIQDWYEDPVTYNYIGHIMTYNVTNKNAERQLNDRLNLIVELEKNYHELSHNEFIKSLKDRIKRAFSRYTLSDLNYKSDGKIIEQVLMLFNIEELNTIHRRFNFILDEKNCWSIEHIKAQHSEIASKADRREYLKKEHERIVKAIELEKDLTEKGKLENILKELDGILLLTEISEDDFEKIATKIEREVDGFDSDDSHHIGNLALLSKNDNASFNNQPFYQKRGQMLVWLNDPDKNIPYSTVRAFLKLYSPQNFSLDYTKWGKQDFDDYYAKLEIALREFI